MGPATALSLDADTALPAMGGASAAIAFATRLGKTLSSILEGIAVAPQAPAAGIVPKAGFDFSGFCASGAATLEAQGWPPETWVPPTDIILTLAECAGSVLARGPVSGSITWSIERVSEDRPSGVSIEGTTDVMLLIFTSPDTRDEVIGAFEVFAQVSAGFVGSGGSDGGVSFRLGAQLDDDLITISQVAQDAGQALRFGCFDVDLAGLVYTMNDYAQMPSLIVLDETGVPSGGEFSLFSGDRSDAGEERSESCFETTDGDNSRVAATFFEGGCIDLNGVGAGGSR